MIQRRVQIRRTSGCAARRGFTLFELLLVISILAMVATISGVGFRATMVRAREKYSLETWLMADHQVRTLANRTRQEYLLRLDRRSGAIQREATAGGDAASSSRVDRNFVLKTNDVDAETFSSSDFVVFYPDGHSENYLIYSGRFVLVIGATGQTLEVANEDEAKAILAERTVTH